MQQAEERRPRVQKEGACYRQMEECREVNTRKLTRPRPQLLRSDSSSLGVSDLSFSSLLTLVLLDVAFPSLFRVPPVRLDPGR
jgi:hypothetical protein